MAFLLTLNAAASSNVLAQGEHGRRAGAELRVIAGDIERLKSSTAESARQKGLIERLRGAIAPLDLLLRLADQESGRPTNHYRSEVAQLSASLNAMDLDLMSRGIKPLVDQFALDPLHSVSSQAVDAPALHQKLCAHCHDNPVSDIERPAYNLHREAQTLPAEEFLARMLIGVRGDRITGIDNPLTDDQLSALIQWYMNAR